MRAAPWLDAARVRGVDDALASVRRELARENARARDLERVADDAKTPPGTARMLRRLADAARGRVKDIQLQVDHLRAARR